MVQTKLFSDLYLATFLNTLAKPFFPCKIAVFFQQRGYL